MKGVKLNSQVIIELGNNVAFLKDNKGNNIYEEIQQKISVQGQSLNIKI